MKRTVAGKEISIYDKRCLHLSKEEVQRRLDAGEPHVIRFNMPTEGTTTFHDVIYGDITVNNEEMEDLILIKSDGYPTYNFANVIDDHLMGITHVVRGNEYLSSSPKYNRIYEAFGWEIPTYVHCPLITDETHQKLSKRCGHSSYEDLIDQGFVTEAVINYVALLGWSPADNREIFSLPELVEAFDYHHINKSPAVFDIAKLKWMNGEYIKKMDPEAFHERALPYLKEVLKKDFDLALIGTHGKWYDHKVKVSNATPADADASVSESAGKELPDGTYNINLDFEGGSGKASIASPAEVTISGGAATATVQWSSPNYDYMIVDGQKYMPVNTDGNSVFEIPVKLDTPMQVIGDTVAMSKPHEVEYTLTFHSDSATEVLGEDGE